MVATLAQVTTRAGDHAWCNAPSRMAARPGVGEGRRAHLDRRRTGEDHLGGIPGGAHAPDADDRQAGHGGGDVVDGAHGDRVDGRSGQPAAPGAERRGARCAGRRPARAAVFMQVTASAPASATAAATATSRSVLGLSFAQQGRPAAADTAATTAAERSASWANR